jgi:hypothetical protein
MDAISFLKNNSDSVAFLFCFGLLILGGMFFIYFFRAVGYLKTIAENTERRTLSTHQQAPAIAPAKETSLLED